MITVNISNENQRRIDALIKLKKFINDSEPAIAPYQDHNGFGKHDDLRSDVRDALVKIMELELEISQIKEALEETKKHYPEAMSTLVFFSIASGLSTGEVTDDVLVWAQDVIDKKEGV